MKKHIWFCLGIALLFCAAANAWEPGTINSVIRSDDLLDIKVFDELEMNTVVRVAGDGSITFPLIGKVAVAGRNVQEAGNEIQRRLEARYLQKAQVNVVIVEYARKLFTILGQVQRSGTYRFPDRERLNLLQAIGIAGGYAPAADMGRVTIKRKQSGREVVLKFNAKKMARDPETPAVEVLPGDVISVAERLF